MGSPSRSDPSGGRRTTSIGRTAVVARKEFTHAVRSRSLRGLFALSIVATVVACRAASGATGGSPADAVVGLLGLPFQLIAPVAAILAGSFAVSGERESGSLRLLLGQSPSRTEVVLGKLLGGIAAIAVGVAATVAVAVPTSHVAVGSTPIAALVGLGIATVLLAAAFLGIAVGVSAAVSTRKRATGAAVGGYFVLAFLWEPVVAGAHYAATGSLPEGPIPAWLSVLDRLNPIEAYTAAADALGANAVAPLRVTFGLLDAGTGGSTAVRGSATAPVYLSDPFAVVVLGLWIAIPAAVGAFRFRRADLH